MCDVLKAEVQHLVLSLTNVRYRLLPSIIPLHLPLSSVVPGYGIPLLAGAARLAVQGHKSDIVF